MVDRVQRTSGNVGQTVVVMPGVLVQRLAVPACRDAMVVVFGGVAGREVDADPRQRTERGENKRDERKPRDDATPVPANEPPVTGRIASTERHGFLTSTHSLQMIRIPA